jgi:hypothetical protein
MTVVVAVAVLLLVLGSDSAAETVPVFVIVPAAFGVTVIVTVAKPPSAIDPRLHVTVPADCVQLPWLGAAEPKVTLAGSVSLSVTFVAVDGPRLLTVIVYVNVPPTVTGFGEPVFVTERSAVAMIVSLSVALLALFGSFTPAGGVTVAVLLSVPVALRDNVPVAVNAAVPWSNRFTVVLMLPVPLDASQLEPVEAVQVQVTLVKLAGKLSFTVAPATPLGPAFETVIVYVTSEPGTTLVWPSVLVIDRSAVFVRAPENSEVLPPGSVAVAVMTC